MAEGLNLCQFRPWVGHTFFPWSRKKVPDERFQHKNFKSKCSELVLQVLVFMPGVSPQSALEGLRLWVCDFKIFYLTPSLSWLGFNLVLLQLHCDLIRV